MRPLGWLTLVVTTLTSATLLAQFDQASYTLNVMDCSDRAKLCSGYAAADYDTYTFLIDGVEVTGPQITCEADTLTRYEMNSLTGGGRAGMHKLNSWKVDGVEYKTDFEELDELVSFMNAEDPNGNWSLDVFTSEISGGDPTRTYDDLFIEVVSLSTTDRIARQFTLLGGGSEFSFSVGTHRIEAFEGGTLHSAADVFVTCGSGPVVYESVALTIPSAGTVCPNVTTLAGPIESISLVPDARYVDVAIGDNGCLSVTPEAIGVDSLAIVYCDAVGTCETAYYVFSSELAKPIVASTVYDTVSAPGSTATYCIDTSELPGNVVTVIDACDEEGAFVEFVLTESTVCTKYRGLTPGGTDSTCVVVCDDLGFCDTTTVVVTTVEPSELEEIDLAFTVPVGIVSSTVLSTDMFDAELAAIENVCAELSGTFVAFTVQQSNYSVEFGGIAIGTERACVEISDVEGTMQRYNVTVTVVPIVPRSDTLRVRNGDTLRWCFPTPEIEGDAVTIYDACTPDASIVEVLTTDNALCVDIAGTAVGNQNVCVTVCNAEGECDEFTLYVDVVPNDDDRLPVANDDTYVVDPSEQNTVTPLENDISDSDFTFAQILDGPRYGQAFFNGAFELVYTLGNAPCRNDTLLYEVCNRFGCDQAEVVFFNDCGLDSPDLIVRGGISPNSDGVNDAFVVTNIEYYPNSILKVYNRWGSRIYEATAYANDWEGTFDGAPIPDGTYFYFIDPQSEGREPIAGYIQVRR